MVWTKDKESRKHLLVRGKQGSQIRKSPWWRTSLNSGYLEGTLVRTGAKIMYFLLVPREKRPHEMI